MSSRCLVRAACLALALAAAGCEREQRSFETPTPTQSPPSQTSVNGLVGATSDAAFRAQQQHEYGENAWQISQGQQYYEAFNCYGCHAAGGGDIGPPLMDDKWIYGGEIDQVYLSIAQGRANGMPAFAGRIPPQQLWQIAAYVRSMSGQGPKAARPARTDHLHTPVPQEAKPLPPRQAERKDS
jgi:cytochrome c oxidase cbb3-type subunit III